MQSPAEAVQWKCSADANAINPPRDPPMATRLCRLAPCYQMPQSAVTGGSRCLDGVMLANGMPCQITSVVCWCVQQTRTPLVLSRPLDSHRPVASPWLPPRPATCLLASVWCSNPAAVPKRVDALLPSAMSHPVPNHISFLHDSPWQTHRQIAHQPAPGQVANSKPISRRANDSAVALTTR